MSGLPEGAKPVRIVLCDCGPIIKKAVDLDRLAERLGGLDGVRVDRQATLCSEAGRAWLEAELAADPDGRLVVVGCSPREHGRTFMEVCRRAGVNPYLLAMANIREQCTWVTPDPEQALTKAEALARAAISRVRAQQAIVEQQVDCQTAVLVVGAGVAGLTAAQLLAQGDHQVILVERSPAVGGRVARLGDLAPDLECASCAIEPLMDEVLHNPKIEVLTLSEVQQVLGAFGNFQVRIHKKARHVNEEACYGCGSCHAVCPVRTPNEHDEGLSLRGAAHFPYTGALPNATVIDEVACLAFRGEPCDECVKACPFGNIDLSQREESIERHVGAIVLATGLEPEPLAKDCMPGQVISAMALERILNSSGPTGGQVGLPDGQAPRSVALLPCVDGRGLAPSANCSQICNLFMSKYAHQIHEKLPDCQIHRVLWATCPGSGGSRDFMAATEALPGVKTWRLGAEVRVSALEDMGSQARIRFVRAGKDRGLSVDLLVVAPPLGAMAAAVQLGQHLRLEAGPMGFFLEENARLASFRSRLKGVYLAGCAQGPKDVRASTTQAAAAAAAVMAELVPGRKLSVEAATAKVDEQVCGACHTCIRTCPFQAIAMDAERRVAVVNELLCRGCGTCVAACPAGALQARHFTDDQLTAELLGLWHDALER